MYVCMYTHKYLVCVCSPFPLSLCVPQKNRAGAAARWPRAPGAGRTEPSLGSASEAWNILSHRHLPVTSKNSCYEARNQSSSHWHPSFRTTTPTAAAPTSRHPTDRPTDQPLGPGRCSSAVEQRVSITAADSDLFQRPAHSPTMAATDVHVRQTPGDWRLPQ